MIPHPPDCICDWCEIARHRPNREEAAYAEAARARPDPLEYYAPREEDGVVVRGPRS